MEGAEGALDLLKIRGSWGTIGDQTVPNSLYIPTLDPDLSTWVGANGSRLSYVGTPTAVSSSVTWQDITSLNIGLDTRMLDNRLGLSFDWFKRSTENMIMPIEGIPVTFGRSEEHTSELQSLMRNSYADF